MAEKNSKEPSPCSGCKYEKSTNIKEFLAFAHIVKELIPTKRIGKFTRIGTKWKKVSDNMAESEAIKICNTIGFAISFSNPQGIPLNATKEGLAEAMRIAIQALEKQIPKKPDFTEDKEFALCPCCNGKGLLNKQKYCDNCGQKIAIDWSDTEWPT